MAAPRVRVKLEGGKALEKKLRILPDAVRGKKLDRAVSDGADVLVDFMQALAPVGDNVPHAFEFIAANQSRDQRPERAQYDVGPAGAGFYLTFHETGTLYLAPQPFMRPAAEAGETAVVDAVRDRLRRELFLTARRR